MTRLVVVTLSLVVVAICFGSIASADDVAGEISSAFGETTGLLCIHIHEERAHVDWITDTLFSNITRPIRITYDAFHSTGISNICSDSIVVIGEDADITKRVSALVEFSAAMQGRISFIHVLDSPCLGINDWYDHPAIYRVFRTNHCGTTYSDKVRWIPLGPGRSFGPPLPAGRALIPAYARQHYCGFVGDLDTLVGRKEQRTEMAEYINAHPELGCYVHSTAGFLQGLPPRQYRVLLTDTTFTLSPRGFRNAEAFRMYEALEEGSIPIIYNDPVAWRAFPNHPLPMVDNWSTDLQRVLDEYRDPAKLADLQRRTYLWWRELTNAAIASFTEAFAVAPTNLPVERFARPAIVVGRLPQADGSKLVVKKTLDVANEQFVNGNFHDALAFYLLAYHETPADVAALVSAGASALEMRNTALAAKLLTEALQQPDSPPGAHGAARVNLYYVEEINQFGFVGEDFWDRKFESLIGDGMRLAAAGQLEAALTNYQRALEIPEKNFFYAYDRQLVTLNNEAGVLCARLKQFECAVEFLKAALQRDPSNAAALDNLDYIQTVLIPQQEQLQQLAMQQGQPQNSQEEYEMLQAVRETQSAQKQQLLQEQHHKRQLEAQRLQERIRNQQASQSEV